jgi:4-amino-4-deoxy-L-arabinose transferase-like glycosyltransferase
MQSFVPGIFCFPLPYSFAAVYGCLATCLCLWLLVHAASDYRPAWMIGSGLASAAALLTKMETGIPGFVALAALIVIRSIKRRSLKQAAADLAALLPGLGVCLLVVTWMVRLRGAEFLIHENFMSWPTAYFMQRYGTLWLSGNGLTVSWRAFLKAILLLPILGAWLGARWILTRYGTRRRVFGLSLLLLAVVAIVSDLNQEIARVFRLIFFPPSAPFLITLMIPLAAWLCWRNRFAAGSVQLFILYIVACCAGLRIFFGMQPTGYPIYYDGPILLAYLLTLDWLFLKTVKPSTIHTRAVLLPCLAMAMAVVLVVAPLYWQARSLVPLVTDRGLIYASPQKVGAYRVAIDFVKRHQLPDEGVLSIPEDMSLYFLSGAHSPLRIYQFGPGVLAPGEMTSEVIREIERKKVRYLIWSNRTFEEYGVPKFGFDYDQPLGQYFSARYRPIDAIGDDANNGWKAVVWERVPDVENSSRIK